MVGQVARARREKVTHLDPIDFECLRPVAKLGHPCQRQLMMRRQHQLQLEEIQSPYLLPSLSLWSHLFPSGPCHLTHQRNCHPFFQKPPSKLGLGKSGNFGFLDWGANVGKWSLCNHPHTNTHTPGSLCACGFLVDRIRDLLGGYPLPCVGLWGEFLEKSTEGECDGRPCEGVA